MLLKFCCCCSWETVTSLFDCLKQLTAALTLLLCPLFLFLLLSFKLPQVLATFSLFFSLSLSVVAIITVICPHTQCGVRAHRRETELRRQSWLGVIVEMLLHSLSFNFHFIPCKQHQQQHSTPNKSKRGDEGTCNTTWSVCLSLGLTVCAQGINESDAVLD